MTFLVTDDCIRLGLRAGAIVFRGVRVGPSPPELRAAVAVEAAKVQRQFDSPAAVRSAPEVAAFHEVLRKVGVNPRRDQPSVDRLLTYALKRGDLPTVNSLVDVYNLVSIRSGLSLGAHDLDRIPLPVSLRLLTGHEPFTPLGSDASGAVNAGEYGYVDGGGTVLCRLDVVQADFSKVTAETTNTLLIVEGTAAHASDVMRRAFHDVGELVVRYCGGRSEVVGVPEMGSERPG
jgi:DNA/RNA-binding domain of Phe-tRNA-synthetase-like protein